jgi:hypothetical protein
MSHQNVFGIDREIEKMLSSFSVEAGSFRKGKSERAQHEARAFWKESGKVEREESCMAQMCGTVAANSTQDK